jgi:hypothetical protein
MKITNANVIKTGEQDLIDAITADLDWGVIEEIFRKEHKIGIKEEIEYKKGDIIAHNNQIAYRLEFEVKVNLAVLLSREGDYISIRISDDEDDPKDATADSPLKEQVDNTHEEQTHRDMETDSAQEDTPPVDNDMKPQSQDDEKKDQDDAFKEALDELDSIDPMENKDGNPYASPDDASPDKISQLASRVGKLMTKEKKK